MRGVCLCHNSPLRGSGICVPDGPPGLAWGFRMIYLPPADMSCQSGVVSRESRVQGWKCGARSHLSILDSPFSTLDSRFSTFDKKKIPRGLGVPWWW
ncbi:MAG: hypothetical protein NC212_05545 [Staphylococcus sp.]|nr:hypothetical protein [Staphylococcus sp.]